MTSYIWQSVACSWLLRRVLRPLVFTCRIHLHLAQTVSFVLKQVIPLLGMCITHQCDYTRISEAKRSSSPHPARLLCLLLAQTQPCLEQLACCSLRGICASLDAGAIYRDMGSGLGLNQGWIRFGLGLELHLSMPQTFRR